MQALNKSKKALDVLIHPLSLGAICLYALNIFVLQPLFPSWWTGKLGDFAWLFFFPYILTVVLTQLLPDGWEEKTFALAVLVIGISFALAKVTIINQWLVLFLQGVLRQPISIARDPTDLLALLALPGCIWLWRKERPAPLSSRKIGLLIIPLAIFFTLADAAMPDDGLTHLEVSGNTVLACSNNHGYYQSLDGGMSWTGFSKESGINDCSIQPRGAGTVVDPQNSSIQYRYAENKIERSADGGVTWQVDYTWRPLSQAGQIYFQTTHQIFGAYSGFPRDAVVDPATGNIVFAMGQEGVLVRQAGSQEYSWVGVESYQRIKIRKIELVTNLIVGEGVLALLTGGLGITLLSLRIKNSMIKRIFMIIAIFGWIMIAWLFPPALSFQSSYTGIISAAGLLLVGVITLILAIASLVQVGTMAKALLVKFGLAFLGIALLFITPYIFWTFNLIHEYYLAAAAAFILSVGFLIYLWKLVPKWSRGDKRLQS